MDPFNASSTASFSTLEARTVLTLVTVGGGGAVGAARPRVRMRKERIKGKVEREGRCILDLGVGKLWNWTGIGEGIGPCCSGLEDCVCVEEGGRRDGTYSTHLLGIPSFKDNGTRIDCSSGGGVVGYAFVLVEWALFLR